MKTIKKIKLTTLSKNDKNALEKRRMNVLKGGGPCWGDNCNCGSLDPVYFASTSVIHMA
ncbi:MAG: TIGR04149 family rSAM-modified RiPP [Dysgonamonadaceae bacterium]|jgi:natural product precursor|nr:TIGR04149 family rSAM-modified RiPP [Dysgonamonadaceae bacterium]